MIAVSLLKPVTEVIISIPLPTTPLGVFAVSFVVGAAVTATVSTLVYTFLNARQIG